eukprot:8545184-Lingulodinium_polyedra.AAC.1
MEAAPPTLARPTPAFLVDGAGRAIVCWDGSNDPGWAADARGRTIRLVIVMKGIAQPLDHGGATRHLS